MAHSKIMAMIHSLICRNRIGGPAVPPSTPRFQARNKRQAITSSQPQRLPVHQLHPTL